jgi:predicted DNA-binding protein (UPF0251 family)
MGREKLKRTLQFKPRCHTFVAKGCEKEEVIHLLHEEIEALYLMDIKRLYQADAATQMGVSRPTFARIIKEARIKVTTMLIMGATLHVEDEKEKSVVMVPSLSKTLLEKSTPQAPYLHLFELSQEGLEPLEVIPNPAHGLKQRPGQVLPQLCMNKRVNCFVVESIGEGLRSALLSKGVFTRKLLAPLTLKKIQAQLS